MGHAFANKRQSNSNMGGDCGIKRRRTMRLSSRGLALQPDTSQFATNAQG